MGFCTCIIKHEFSNSEIKWIFYLFCKQSSLLPLAIYGHINFYKQFKPELCRENDIMNNERWRSFIINDGNKLMFYHLKPGAMHVAKLKTIATVNLL